MHLTQLRHIEVGSNGTEYPDSVYYAADGQRFKELMGVDAANLYGYAISEPLPGGQGILYKRKTGANFTKQLMIDREGAKTKKYSKEAINWLCWYQQKSEFQNIKIEHFLNGGEHEVTLEDTTFTPDGYCEIGGVMHIFQFHGCYFHQHDCHISRQSKRVKESKDYQLRCAKIDGLCSKYGVLHRIYGCEWKKLKRTVQFYNPFDPFPGKEFVTEAEIVNAILNGSLFGLIKCSITSPQSVIDRYMSVNYPPVTSKITVEESMISPEIRQRMKNTGKKISPDQLTQVTTAS